VSRSGWIALALLVALATAGVKLSAATYTSGSGNPRTTVGTQPDWAAPTAGAAVIAKTAGGAGGYVRAGGSYYVLANISDTGNPASGTATATANVSAISAAQTAARLSSGSFTSDGTTFNHRSAQLTVDAAKAEGTYAYTLALTDAAGNAATRTGFSVVVDNTPPSASDVQTTNVTGGTAGKPEAGDRIMLTYSEPIDPDSIISGWTGSATNVVVRITAQGNRNTLTIRDAANAGALPLGSVDLGRGDYVAATRDFGATGAAAQMTQSGNAITITLGTPNGTTTTAAGAGTMTWTPSSAATDRAGNPASTSARTASGSARVGF
jgi:hypothetical protein